MVLTDWQIQHQSTGYIMGGLSGDIILDGIAGLRAEGSLRGGGIANAYADGDLPDLSFSGGRAVTFQFQTKRNPGPTLEAALESLGAVFTAVRDPAQRAVTASSYMRNAAMNTADRPESSLTVKLPWRPRPILLLGRPSRYDIVQDQTYSAGKGYITAEWKVPDGLFYDPQIVTGVAPLGAANGGTSFPITFPFTFGSATSTDFTLTNAGLTAGPCSFKITGPCLNPTVINRTTGEYISLTIALSASDVLWIDCQRGNVWKNWVYPANTALNWGSSLFQLAPGPNVIGFRSTDPSRVAGALYGYGLSAWQAV